MADRTQRVDAPTTNPDAVEHRRQIALRANASLSKNGGNSMQVPLKLYSVVAADIASPASTDPLYPANWEGALVYVSDNGTIAYSDGTDWLELTGS